jgi:aminoglycoside phosphotransferase family enzyme/predicted kinase
LRQLIEQNRIDVSPDSVAAPFDPAELSQAVFPHPVTRLRVIETHISWVVLTGQFAYKIKKPVSFDFVDASTLERRLALCREELRLNRRLAPDLYLDVVALSRSGERIVFGDSRRAFEYAVRMREFDPSLDLATQLDDGRVWVSDIRALASRIADFHRDIRTAPPDTRFGDVNSVRDQIVDNQVVLERHVDATEDRAAAHRLGSWLQDAIDESELLISRRKSDGAVRECHGDLHARNIVRWRDQWTPFDCIEFNPELRWIDVVSDIAFLFMDLVAHRRADLAYAFLSRYVEETGDYEGLRLLPMYAVYRAVVRAKIDALTERTVPAEKVPALRARRSRRLQVAAQLITDRSPALLLTHGVTGCGKSWLSERLIPAIHAVRVRSDLERKRLAGIAPLKGSGSGVGKKLYAPAVTDRVYARLAECADAALAAGFTVIVDASFLQAAQREKLRQVAILRDVPYIILSCDASLATLRSRLKKRALMRLDPSEATRAVLDHQLESREPLTPPEENHTLRITTDAMTAVDDLVDAIADRLHAR